jgi:hypothetical protein
MDKASDEHKAEIAAQIKENEDKSIRERIQALTERYKDDPTKLALLASLAADYASITE